MHRLVGIEEARPGRARDFFGQGRWPAAAVERVVAVPERAPLRKIGRRRRAHDDCRRFVHAPIVRRSRGLRVTRRPSAFAQCNPSRRSSAMAGKDFDTMEDSNRSDQPEHSRRQRPGASHGAARHARRGGERVVRAAGRRVVLRPARRATTTPALAPSIGFKGIAVDASDKLLVPEGYTASVIAAWGEPVGVPGNMPAWLGDGSHSSSRAGGADGHAPRRHGVLPAQRQQQHARPAWR